MRFSDFADGNNQESSSEAVNAWAGAYHWAQATENQQAADTARKLYASEIAATTNYWLNDQRSQPGFENYEHPLVSLVWGVKHDYTTFFSLFPQAILSIQLISMSPGIHI